MGGPNPDGGRLCGVEHRVGQAREQVVRRAELGLIDPAEIDKIVERAVDGAQAHGGADVRHQREQILAVRMRSAILI